MGMKMSYGINTSGVCVLQFYGQHNETSISSNRLVNYKILWIFFHCFILATTVLQLYSYNDLQQTFSGVNKTAEYENQCYETRNDSGRVRNYSQLTK